MMMMSVDTGRTFTAGRPVVLFKGSYLNSPTRIRANYDVSPNGRQFLMVQGGEPSRQIKVVLNLSQELKRLVPVGK